MAVVTTDQALRETQRAFDGVAASYDRSNADNVILCAMRRRVRATLERLVAPGSSLLNLGCGPGTDDIALAQLGYRLTAIDWSRAMVEEARRRVRSAGVEARVQIAHLGIHELHRLAPATYDAAFSNFGPLNCVCDVRAGADAIAARIRPRGLLVASVIGRWCPWEIVLFGLRGAWARATVRLTRQQVPVPLEGGTVWTRYYSPREFVQLFAPSGFAPVWLRALSLAVPPPYLDSFAARHPVLIDRLHRIDDRIGRWPLARSLGDHFLIVLRRT